MSDRPETLYAWAGDVCIAYQVIGDGPRDLIMVPGMVSHLDYFHDFPGYTAFHDRLADFARVVVFDKRGQGLSDGIAGAPSLEHRMEDLRAVMAAVGSRQATLFGLSEGGSMAVMFAASFPEVVEGLVLYGSFAKFVRSEDYPLNWDLQTYLKLARHWGKGYSLRVFSPSLANDPAALAMWSRGEKQCTTPGGVRRLIELNAQIDIRPVLGSVRTRTVVLHRKNDAAISVENGRYLAAHIPGARLIELSGHDHPPWIGDSDAIVDAVREFVTGSRTPSVPHDTVLASVLFVDIVGSSEMLARLGDHRWRELLDHCDRAATDLVAAHRGRLVKNTGDGFLATFDGPSRAVVCAQAVAEQVRGLGVVTRAGLHIGEIERRGSDIAGMTVNIAARIQHMAGAGEILVSRTLTDLVPGSGLAFEDRGSHSLKGIPGEWQLLRLADNRKSGVAA